MSVYDVARGMVVEPVHIESAHHQAIAQALLDLVEAGDELEVISRGDGLAVVGWNEFQATLRRIREETT